MSKKAYKTTSIPYQTKYGLPMEYVILDNDGNTYTKVSRAECLKREDNEYHEFPQRWYVDLESGLVVRLPRTKLGETIARENMRSTWRETKQQERLNSCVLKNTKKCDGWKATLNHYRECDDCRNKNKLRAVELNIIFNIEDNEKTCPEPADDFDFVAMLEHNSLLDTLYEVINSLSPEDIDLIMNIYWHNKTERELAPLLGYKQPKSVNKRKQKILEDMRNNENLKAFFE